MGIREARLDDKGGIVLLLTQLWPEKELDKDAVAELFAQGMVSDRRAFLCAQEGGAIVGFCAVEYHDSLWHEGDVAYVEVLVVDAEFRNRGIGALLMGEVERLACARRCKAIELDTAFHRERAHAFYERLGFTRRGFVFLKEL